MKEALLQFFGMILVGLSVGWLCNGGGLWFLIPWTLGWYSYNLGVSSPTLGDN